MIKGAPSSKLLKVETQILTKRICFYQSLQLMQSAVVGRSEFSIPQENDSIYRTSVYFLAEYFRSINVDTSVGLDTVMFHSRGIVCQLLLPWAIFSTLLVLSFLLPSRIHCKVKTADL